MDKLLKNQQNNIFGGNIFDKGFTTGLYTLTTKYNPYSGVFFNDVIASAGGIMIHGEIINNITYADIPLVLANSYEDLQVLMNRISLAFEQFGLKLKFNKTKQMLFSKEINE